MATAPNAGNSDAPPLKRRAFNPMVIAVGVLAIAVLALAIYVFQLQRSMSQRPATAEVAKTAAPAQETILAGSTAVKPTADELVLKMIEAQTAGDDAMVEQIRLQLDGLPKASRGDRKAARSLNDAGLKALQDSDNTSAIRTFSEAQKIDASDPEIANNLAHALVKNDRLVDASIAIMKSLQLNSVRSAAWGTLALIYAKTGFPERASASFQIAFRYSRSSQGTVTYLQNLVESDTDANVRQSASLAMQSKAIKDWVSSQNPSQEGTAATEQAVARNKMAAEQTQLTLSEKYPTTICDQFSNFIAEAMSIYAKGTKPEHTIRLLDASFSKYVHKDYPDLSLPAMKAIVVFVAGPFYTEAVRLKDYNACEEQRKNGKLPEEMLYRAQK